MSVKDILIKNCYSVLMVKAAGLSLASFIIAKLQLCQVNFLTDNQVLVDFLLGNNQESPPD
jgi:hypothetical protein